MSFPKLLDASLRHPASAYLLSGPPGAGKRASAEKCILQLLETQNAKRETRNAKRETSDTTSDAPRSTLPAPRFPLRAHPDLILLDVEEGKKQISVEQVREARERLFLRPAVAPRVVAYLPHADRLNESGMNALLKVLEEPPAGAVFVLVAENPSRFPSTVLSRMVQIPFHAAPSDDATSSFADAFFAAQTLGARLCRIEELAKACDAEEDPERAWQEKLGAAMRRWRHGLPTGRQVIFGIALIAARRLIGTALSPRIALEAGAIRMSGDADREARRLMPTHVPRTIPLFFENIHSVIPVRRRRTGMTSILKKS